MISGNHSSVLYTHYFFHSEFWVIFHALLSSAEFFFKINFFKKSFRNVIGGSTSLDPDQVNVLSSLVLVQTIC